MSSVIELNVVSNIYCRFTFQPVSMSENMANRVTRLHNQFYIYKNKI